jgi:predicted nuclease of predicted toxin-antitoxin system
VRFVADECVSPVLVAWLRAEGHDVLSILEEHRSAADEFVLALAARKGRILLTEDNDFGQLIFRGDAAPPTGVVLLRMLDATVEERCARLEAVLREIGPRVLGHHIVAGPVKIRIRKLP